MLKEKKVILLIALIYSVVSTFIYPSEFYREDMAIHGPFIQSISDPSLYKKDILVHTPNPQKDSTFYYQSMAYIQHVFAIPLFTQMRILYGIYVFIFAMVILYGSLRYTSLAGAVLFLTLVAMKLPIGGSATSTMETEFLPRSIGGMFSFIGLYAIQQKKYIRAVLCFILGLIFHPISILYGVGVVTAYVFIGTAQKKLKIIVSFLCIVCLIFGFVAFSTIDTVWLSIIRERNAYAFLDLWASKSIIILLLFLLPGCLFLWLKPKKITSEECIQLCRATFILSIGAMIVHVFFVLIKPTQIGITLQLGRVWYYPVLASFLIVSIWSIKIIKRPTAIILCSIAFFVAVGLYKDMRINYETEQRWVAMQSYIKDNTKKDCLFLVPFFSKGFRINSERSSIGDYKDGALSFYSRDFATEWKKRLNDFGELSRKSDREILLLRDTYNFDYVIAPISENRTFTALYRSGEYALYDLRTQEDCL